MRLIREIIIHQTGTETGTLESIRRYHVETLGWNDIGYHFLLTSDAVVHKGRPQSIVGSHCQGDNAHSLGVCCVGKGNAFPLGTGYMTLAMFIALLKLHQELQRAYPAIKRNICGHREKASGINQGKSCPGFDVEILRQLC